MTRPQATGNWTLGMLHDTWQAEHAYSDGNRVCLITVGDGSTARRGYVWQSTTRREELSKIFSYASRLLNDAPARFNILNNLFVFIYG